MTRGPDKSCLFTDTHPHPFSAQASENVQVSHIFCKSNAIQCGLCCLLYKSNPVANPLVSKYSSPSINISVHIQAFKVWGAPSVQVSVCVVCACPRVSSCMCASAFTLVHKRSHEYKSFPFLLALLGYVAGKRHTVLSKGSPPSSSDLYLSIRPILRGVRLQLPRRPPRGEAEEIKSFGKNENVASAYGRGQEGGRCGRKGEVTGNPRSASTRLHSTINYSFEGIQGAHYRLLPVCRTGQ